MEPVADPRPDAPRRPTTGSPYELFVVGVSLLSLVNIVLLLLPLESDSKEIIVITDAWICLVFMGDFLQRLIRSHPHRDYFFRRLGWLDLLGSLPFPGLRLFRIVRTVRLVQELQRKGGHRVVREISAGRAESGLLLVLFLVIVTVEFSAVTVLSIENDAMGSNISSASDALWWAWVTMTTVGYGDRYPVTEGGRFVGVILMTLGVGLFGVFAAFVANLFLSPRAAARRHDSPLSEVDDLRALVEQNERLASELRARLDRVEAAMRPKRGQ